MVLIKSMAKCQHFPESLNLVEAQVERVLFNALGNMIAALPPNMLAPEAT